MSSQQQTNLETVIRFWTFITASGAHFEMDIVERKIRRIKPSKTTREPAWYTFKSVHLTMGEEAIVFLKDNKTRLKTRRIVAIRPQLLS